MDGGNGGLVVALLLQADTTVAKRLNMSVDAFRAKSADEWWTLGVNAKEEKLADTLAVLTCSEKMVNTVYDDVIRTFFGPIAVKFSKCPILPFPLEVMGNPTFAGQEVKASSRARFEWKRDFYLKDALFGVE